MKGAGGPAAKDIGWNESSGILKLFCGVPCRPWFYLSMAPSSPDHLRCPFPGWAALPHNVLEPVVWATMRTDQTPP